MPHRRARWPLLLAACLAVATSGAFFHQEGVGEGGGVPDDLAHGRAIEEFTRGHGVWLRWLPSPPADAAEAVAALRGGAGSLGLRLLGDGRVDGFVAEAKGGRPAVVCASRLSPLTVGAQAWAAARAALLPWTGSGTLDSQMRASEAAWAPAKAAFLGHGQACVAYLPPADAAPMAYASHGDEGRRRWREVRAWDLAARAADRSATVTGTDDAHAAGLGSAMGLLATSGRGGPGTRGDAWLRAELAAAEAAHGGSSVTLAILAVAADTARHAAGEARVDGGTPGGWAAREAQVAVLAAANARRHDLP